MWLDKNMEIPCTNHAGFFVLAKLPSGHETIITVKKVGLTFLLERF